MEIYPLGHSSFRIKGKSATVVFDPYDNSSTGLKMPKVETADVVMVSHDHPDHNSVHSIPGSPFTVIGPGEYEINGVTVVGVPTFHDDKNGEERGLNCVYKITIDDVNICHLGDLGHKLSDEQISQIGNVDILFIPVGGHYTIDSKTASQVVAQLEPVIVIPMHYQRTGLDAKLAEVLEPVTAFTKEMGVEGLVPQPKLVISKDKLPETTTVIVLE